MNSIICKNWVTLRFNYSLLGKAPLIKIRRYPSQKVVSSDRSASQSPLNERSMQICHDARRFFRSHLRELTNTMSMQVKSNISCVHFFAVAPVADGYKHQQWSCWACDQHESFIGARIAWICRWILCSITKSSYEACDGLFLLYNHDVIS